ncbi:MAG: nickel pincer cofactor biosynthesis protein LarC [Actinomycetota bacterium]|nr:MAG: hypothetical protein FD171_2189 [Actinomycetota bacterium]MDO8950672.1 nickel pincer cofactor biosynthesis protein LarC [Actinomycetota bacterium]MDP3630918.1 nickel pincer cofactor biosynthesis protein LarC [Actinomycetota bacterium]
MIAYLDCSTGISGDKFLGALVGAGFTTEALLEALAPLGLSEAPRVHELRSSGITAVGIDVTDASDPLLRHWADIRALLERASLPAPVREGALRAFTLLAQAEARVHGVVVDDVHFHEVGAADTIVDIVGVAAGLHALGIERLTCTPIALGSGTVATSHGILPVPAPATAALLEGVPTYGGDIASELTTPTGAALIRAFVDDFGPLPAMTIRAIGTGAGTRDIGAPNIARIIVGDPPDLTPVEEGVEEVALLESNVDHLSAEHLAYAAERLLEAGALDVWQTPIVMKKGRAAVTLSVLTTPDSAGLLAGRLMAETGSLGVRVHRVQRRVAEREIVEVETSFGCVRMKTWRLGERRGVRAEFDDVARIATDTGRPAAEIAALLAEEARAVLGIDD